MYNSGCRARLLLVCLPIAYLTAVSCYGSETAKAPTQDFSKEAYVVESSADKVKFEKDGTYLRQLNGRVKIQSEAGIEHFGIVKFAYSSSEETFVVDYLRVVKTDGTTIVTPPDTFQDMPSDVSRLAPFYSDEHETQIAVKGLGVGDVLEYQVHWQHNKPLIPGQFWYVYNFAAKNIVLKETVELDVPHGRTIKLKSPKAKPNITQSGAYDVYTWTSSRLSNEDDKTEKVERQREAWEQIRGRNDEPDIQLTSFQSLQELGDWYRKLQSDRVQPTAEIQARAAELTKGLTDEDAKIRALYNFVSTKYRYIGIAFGVGRFQPHTAAEVLANQYGDCKDKHTLLASLLAAVGIKAYPALISTTYEVDPDVPSPAQFNHVITAIPRKDGYLFLDTTAEVAPFGLLLPPLRDKRALVMPDDKPPLLALTPADEPFPSVQTFEMKAKLDDAGVLEGTAESTDRGYTEVLFRAGFRMVPLTKWKDLVQRVSYAMGFGGDVSEVTASQPEKTDEPFRFSYNYKRKDYSDWGNRRIGQPLPSMTLPDIDDDIVPTAPTWLGSPGEIDFRSTLELPKGYTPELPQAVHLKNDFATYDATYSYSAGVITAERHLTLKMREVPASEYKEYKTFRKAVEDDYGRYTSLSVGNSSSSITNYQNEIWNLPYSTNAEAGRLYDDARAAFQRHDVQGEISNLKKAVDVDPKFVRAWLWLGEIYKFTRQNDLAVQCYKKAIEIDPQQAVSYKALAITLLSEKKYDEAVAALKQLVKVSPDQADEYLTLGSTLVFMKRYSDALPVLETAAKLAPDQSGPQMLLGRAYIHMGNVDFARASFQKAVTLDTKGVMLNDIAYAMAEENFDLDQARDYAVKAVTQEEEDSTKIDLSNLQMSDLAHSLKLSAYWDTLGWVCYQMGDLKSAEAYLNSAWILSQRSTIGEHLGRLYEKEKKREMAIHTYQLAYAASPSIPTTIPLNGDPQVQRNDFANVKEDLRRLNASEGPMTLMTDLNDLRTVKLPRLVSGTANADFFLLFSPGGKVEAKFISGSDSLKGAAAKLEAIRFKTPFPDQHSARILRRGILGCYTYSGCTFVMMPPSTVNSVQ
jgi:tetratricopeptide (TPR) repeat protein